MSTKPWGALRGDHPGINSLVSALRDLIQASGLTLRSLPVPYGKSSISDKLSGRVPVPWELVEAVVLACAAAQGMNESSRDQHLRKFRALWEWAEDPKSAGPAYPPSSVSPKSGTVPVSEQPDATLPQAAAPDSASSVRSQATDAGNRFKQLPGGRWVVAVLAIAAIGAATTITVMSLSPRPVLGPEVSPPFGNSQFITLLSASGFAAQDQPSSGQTGELVVAAVPTTTDSQRWAGWYEGQPNQSDPKSVVFQTYGSDGVSAAGQGSVIDFASSGIVLVDKVVYSPTQFWTFHQTSGSWYQIVDSQSLCLTAVQAGAPLQLRSCDGSNGQRWRVTDLTEGAS